MARGAAQISSRGTDSVGVEQYLVGQKQSRGNQFLERFLAKKSRSSAEQQQREIRGVVRQWLAEGFLEGN